MHGDTGRDTVHEERQLVRRGFDREEAGEGEGWGLGLGFGLG